MVRLGYHPISRALQASVGMEIYPSCGGKCSYVHTLPSGCNSQQQNVIAATDSKQAISYAVGMVCKYADNWVMREHKGKDRYLVQECLKENHTLKKLSRIWCMGMDNWALCLAGVLRKNG